MRTTLLLLLLAIPTLAKDWTKYESKDGAFTVSVPSKLRTNSTTIATDAGDLKVVTESVSENSKLLLSVTYTDYPPRFSLVDKTAFFDAVRDGLKTKGAKVLREEATATTRDVTISHGKNSIRTRLLLDGTRLYQVTVTGPPDQIESKPALLFLDSFQLKK